MGQGGRTLTLTHSGKTVQPPTVTPRTVAGAAGKRQPQRGKENRSWFLGSLQNLKTRLPAQGCKGAVYSLQIQNAVGRSEGEGS